MRRAGACVEEAVGGGPVEQGSGGGDDVFAGVSAVAAVAPGPCGGGHLMLHGLDVGGADRVQRLVGPGVGYAPIAHLLIWHGRSVIRRSGH